MDKKYQIVNGTSNGYYEEQIQTDYIIKFFQICQFADDNNLYHIRMYQYKTNLYCNYCENNFLPINYKDYTLNKKELKKFLKTLETSKNIKNNNFKIVYKYYAYKNLINLQPPTAHDLCICNSELL